MCVCKKGVLFGYKLSCTTTINAFSNELRNPLDCGFYTVVSPRSGYFVLWSNPPAGLSGTVGARLFIGKTHHPPSMGGGVFWMIRSC